MKDLVMETDLIVFSSHDFGSNEIRTTALMTEFAQRNRVYFIESPIVGVVQAPTYLLKKNEHAVTVIRPYLPATMTMFEQKDAVLALVKELISDEHISHYTLWTDTPKCMSFIRKLCSEVIIYDCINDYSACNPQLEKELFQSADLVLTSGLSSYNKTVTINTQLKDTNTVELGVA